MPQVAAPGAGHSGAAVLHHQGTIAILHVTDSHRHGIVGTYFAMSESWREQRMVELLRSHPPDFVAQLCCPECQRGRR